MKRLFFVMVGLLIFAVGCNAGTQSFDDAEATTGGVITPLDELVYDWGDISIEGGDVDHGFHFRNDGEGDLILTGALTSCMCTEAYFELPDGSMSPSFGMHGKGTRLATAFFWR